MVLLYKAKLSKSLRYFPLIMNPKHQGALVHTLNPVPYCFPLQLTQATLAECFTGSKAESLKKKDTCKDGEGGVRNRYPPLETPALRM